MSVRDNDATSAEAPTARRKDPPVGESEKLSPGDTVGSYVIEAEHSRGGFSTVYRARHTKLDRPVAIKVLSKFLSHAPEMIQRFENEARAINRIRHPNIVDVTDFGVLSSDRPYFVMEWLEGSDLRDVLRDHGPMDPARVADVTDDIASGLEAAHGADIVHRDLKAANVIALSAGGPVRCKLLDFGVAKMLESEAEQHSPFVTEMGVRVGTPHAMAPEQIRCQPVSPATDVYALGVLVYELLAGQPPFHSAASPQDLATRHLRDAPPLISEHADVPEAVDAVIARCMEKDPADRYQSAREVAIALREALQAAPQRNKRVWPIAVAAVLVVGAAAAGAAIMLGGGDDGARKPTVPVVVSDAPADAAPHATDAAGAHDAAPAMDAAPAALPVPIPETFDANVALAHALGLARTQFPNARLYRIDVSFPTLVGTNLDLTVHPRSQVEFQFVTLSDVATDSCTYEIRYSRSGFEHEARKRLTAAPCTDDAIRAPLCAVDGVMRGLAARQGLETKRITSLRFMQVSGQPEPSWHATTDDSIKTAPFPDECPR